MRSPTHPELFAVGDAAAITVPKLGSLGHQQAQIVARQIAIAVGKLKAEDAGLHLHPEILCFGDIGGHRGFYIYSDTWYGGHTSVFKMGHAPYVMKLAFKEMYFRTGGRPQTTGLRRTSHPPTHGSLPRRVSHSPVKQNSTSEGEPVEHKDPGDFGRRVAERRRELGLSRAEVARQTGMDPGYLEYLEERPGASPDISTRRRLAVALSTSTDRLEGRGFGEPVGAGHPPGGVAVVEELDRAGCYGLLRHGGIGRVLFVAARGPIGLPVNFRLLDDDIVFRTGDGSIRSAVEAGRAISVEVDRLDDALGEGWSVLATGHAVVVEDVEELGRIDALEIQSWAGEHRPTAVRLAVDEITGRRIRRHL